MLPPAWGGGVLSVEEDVRTSTLYDVLMNWFEDQPLESVYELI